MIVGVAFAGIFLGFLAGLLSLRVASRWCCRCGEDLTCPVCAGVNSRGRISRR